MLFTMITQQEKHLPLYITGIGIQKDQESIVRPDGYPYYQWTYCSKGEGTFVVDGKEFKIAEGTGFFFSPKIPHKYYSTTQPWETYWINFEGSSIPSILELFGIHKWEVFIPSSIESALNQFDEMEDLLTQDDPEKVINTSLNLYSFLFTYKTSKKISTYQQTTNRLLQLKPVLLYMDENFNHSLSLDELSSLIHISSNHLCKLFKLTFGMTPFHYLIQMRIQNAKQLLIQSPELQINEIANRVGYTDFSYFCSIFKKQELMTPLAFRKMYGV
ncbi:MAG: AraC family transcriptional regulator [Vallitaleaceae bacterium]|nr:AraC family transcriptional regulator [Vallitaleaceae bacterium]